LQWRPDYTSCGASAPVAEGVGSPLKKERIKRRRKEGRNKKEKK